MSLRRSRHRALTTACAALAAAVFMPVPASAATALCHGEKATIVGSGRIDGTPQRDVIVGSLGEDVIHGLGGRDLICGKAGHDRILGGPGKDRLYGNAGWDRLEGGKYADKMWGGKHDDQLWGDGGPDRLHGGRGYGYDKLNGNSGNDKLIGGEGPDDAVFIGSGPVRANLATGVAATADGTDELRDIEAVWGSESDDVLTGSDASLPSEQVYALYGGPGDDELRGGAERDLLGGGPGNDVLTGAGGNDHLSGGRGDDALSGGAGSSDSAAYGYTLTGWPPPMWRTGFSTADAPDQPVSLDLGAGTATTPFGDDTLAGIEAAVGSQTSDTLIGDEGSNFLYSGGFHPDFPNAVDTFVGKGGDDYIDAEWTPRVIIDAGAGSDWINGASGDDTIHAGAGPDMVRGHGGRDTTHGDAGDDFIDGGEALFGDAGDDVVAGGTTTVLDGGVDHDRCYGTDPTNCEVISTSVADLHQWSEQWWNGLPTPDWYRKGWNVSTCAPGESPDCPDFGNS